VNSSPVDIDERTGKVVAEGVRVVLSSLVRELGLYTAKGM
jgi:hypothetical protein